MSRVLTVLLYGVVLVVGLELALEEAFLVSARPLGQPLPVAAAVAVVGNLAVGTAGARVLRRPLGAAVPALVWLGVALALGLQGPGGDKVVTNTWRGIAFLVGGAAAAAVPVALAGAVKHGATPGAGLRR